MQLIARARLFSLLRNTTRVDGKTAATQSRNKTVRPTAMHKQNPSKLSNLRISCRRHSHSLHFASPAPRITTDPHGDPHTGHTGTVGSYSGAGWGRPPARRASACHPLAGPPWAPGPAPGTAAAGSRPSVVRARVRCSAEVAARSGAGPVCSCRWHTDASRRPPRRGASPQIASVGVRWKIAVAAAGWLSGLRWLPST
eukprot:1772340-Prymnesium_polylepis.1